jgi:hypothetical protein
VPSHRHPQDFLDRADLRLIESGRLIADSSSSSTFVLEIREQTMYEGLHCIALNPVE